MSVSTIPIVEYRHFFKDEGRDAKEYLRGISEDILRKMAPTLLSFDMSDEEFSEPMNMIKFWLGEQHPILPEINVRYQGLIAQSKIDRWRLVIPYNSLRLIEEVRKMNEVGDSSQEPEDSNLNLLKAYLILNQYYANYFDSKIGETTRGLDGYFKGAAMICCIGLKDNDITNYNLKIIFGTSLIKAIHFFEFMDSNDYCKPYIRKICDKYNVSSWKEFVLRLTGIVRFAIERIDPNKYSQVTFDDSVDLTLFDDLNHDFSYNGEELDFIKVRSNPLIKIDERTYLIIFDLFLVQKLFKGLYWLLMSFTTSQRERDELRQKITYDFSEKYLLYKTLDDLFSKAIKFSGEEIDDYGIKGFVDFYARDTNDIYLFESKDVLIGAKTKTSGDWNLISSDLKKKFHSEIDQEGKVDRKAILQLLNSIKIIIRKEFAIDKELKDINRAIFYPILVVHDEIFNLPGICIVLNNWFREELRKDVELRSIDNRIKGITMIDINTILFNKNILKENPTLLKKSINNAYLDFRKLTAPTEIRRNMSREEVESMMVPFEQYLENEIPPEAKRSPTEFLEAASRLFEEG